MVFDWLVFGSVWCFVLWVDLYWWCWDVEWVVFDVGLGQMYKVDMLMVMMLMVLEGGFVELDIIQGVIVKEFEFDGQVLSDVVVCFFEFLVDFGCIGLVEIIVG